MLELTKETVGAVKEMAGSSETSGIRIFMVERAGGNPFAAAVVDGPAAGDELIENDGARIYLEPTAAEALATKVLDTNVAADGTVHLQVREP